MRFDLGSHQARNQFVVVAPIYLHVHDGLGLRGGLDYLSGSKLVSRINMLANLAQLDWQTIASLAIVGWAAVFLAIAVAINY